MYGRESPLSARSSGSSAWPELVIRPVGITGGRPFVLSGTILLALGVLTAEVVAGHSPKIGVAVTLAVSTVALAHRALTRWRNLVAATLLVILFIPIRRYGFPAALPFELEPYRVLIALVAVAWVFSMLVDPHVRFRRSIIDLPMAVMLLVAAASIAVNSDRLATAGLGSLALKSMTFLFSFVVFFYFIVSVVRRPKDVDFLLGIFVAGGAVVAASSLVELWSGFNVFDHLDRVFPVLVKTTLDTGGLERGGYKRVFGSAQHPIPLGALFALLVPLAVYLYQSTKKKTWLAAGFLLCFATVATVSRTGVLSLLVVALVYLLLRPADMLRYWPLLLPVLIAVKLAMPGVLGTFYNSFFPRGGLIAEQDGTVGSSRVASFGPAMQEVAVRPVLGLGYGTRIPTGPDRNSFIVDDQWVSTAMETGLLGVIVWVWLFVVFLRKMFRAARRESGPRSWLFTGIAASTAGFVVGMATYDAFSFIQVTFGLFVLLAIGSVAYTATEWSPEASRGRRAARIARHVTSSHP
jgi:O-Antigen ligase